ncbi:MAG: LAGLIDADG family homing endonuclease [bacterium]|nr:LAGLIDADG family homing endonuclease [bacterium]
MPSASLTRAQKISATMKRRKIDNFAIWRRNAIKSGKIIVKFPPLKRNGDFAELIGVLLGDGHLQKFPRTERLLIFSNTNNPGFIGRYTELVEKLFKKKTYVYKQSDQNCMRISLYQKCISERLGIPTGARKSLSIKVPKWILDNRRYVVRYLRGLYEAEGSLSHHEPTCTHKLSFSNMNASMLENVYSLMSGLGFHPHRDAKRVQLSRKEEVRQAVELLEFRKY